MGACRLHRISIVLSHSPRPTLRRGRKKRRRPAQGAVRGPARHCSRRTDHERAKGWRHQQQGHELHGPHALRCVERRADRDESLSSPGQEIASSREEFDDVTRRALLGAVRRRDGSLETDSLFAHAQPTLRVDPNETSTQRSGDRYVRTARPQERIWPSLWSCGRLLETAPSACALRTGTLTSPNQAAERWHSPSQVVLAVPRRWPRRPNLLAALHLP